MEFIYIGKGKKSEKEVREAKGRKVTGEHQEMKETRESARCVAERRQRGAKATEVKGGHAQIRGLSLVTHRSLSKSVFGSPGHNTNFTSQLAPLPAVYER